MVHLRLGGLFASASGATPSLCIKRAPCVASIWHGVGAAESFDFTSVFLRGSYAGLMDLLASVGHCGRLSKARMFSTLSAIFRWLLKML